MRDPDRIPRILNLIRSLWLIYPDQRFFQLLHNLDIPEGSDPFYIEDDVLETAVTASLDDLATADVDEDPDPDSATEEWARGEGANDWGGS